MVQNPFISLKEQPLQVQPDRAPTSILDLAALTRDLHTRVRGEVRFCREQIAQTTKRQGLHLAQVIHPAMQEAQGHPVTAFPEAAYLQRTAKQLQRTSRHMAPVLLMGSSLVGLLIWLWKRR